MRKSVKLYLLLSVAGILSAGALFAFRDTPALIDEIANYPNPFDSRREETFITYRLAQNAEVRVRIHDLFGNAVRDFTFSPGEMGGRQGTNTIRWDGTDQTGQKVSKGGYVCQILVQGEQTVRGIRKIGVIH